MTTIVNTPIAKYKKIWESIKLNKGYSFIDSAINELGEYFNLSKDEAMFFLLKSDKTIVNEWNKYFLNHKLNNNSIIDFYNSTQSEIFVLMNWHYINFLNGPLQYAFAFDIAKRYNHDTFLDYGSGVATGALLFAKNKFKVTLADVSSANLNFSKFRFKKRGLNADFVDLKTESMLGREYDIITCFDVLEHSYTPLSILINLRKILKNNGHLIINTPFGKDVKRPMHVVTDKKIVCRIRSNGFSFVKNLIKECKEGIGRDIIVLKKTSRSHFLNECCFLEDTLRFFTKKMFKKLVSITSKYFFKPSEGRALPLS